VGFLRSTGSEDQLWDLRCWQFLWFLTAIAGQQANIKRARAGNGQTQRNTADVSPRPDPATLTT
jgi:hypothetical protein